MDKLLAISSSRKQWPLLIALIFPILVVVLAMLITSHNNGRLYLSLITASGGLGGVLSATRLSYLNIPHEEKPNKYVIGFLTDILAGIAGAYIVFLVFPDRFIVPPGNYGDTIDETIELRVNIKLIAISVVGGYLGRALLERVGEDLFSMVKSLKSQVEQVDEKVHERFEIESTLSEIFYIPKANEDVTIVNRFVDLLNDADPRTRMFVFYRTMNKRLENSLELGHIIKLSQESSSNNIFQQRVMYLKIIRDRLQSFAKIYRCLIESFKGSSETSSEPLYFYHKELAYSIKDALLAEMFEKNNDITDIQDWSKLWGEVLEHLKDSRNLLRKNSDHIDYKLVSAELYKNQAICKIMLDGNILHNRKSPPVEVGRIKNLLQDVKDEAPSEENNDLYPISEWQRLNHCLTD